MPKFNPPESLNFQRPNWPEWKARFERYQIATTLQNEEGDIQGSTLNYSMGIEAEKILRASTLKEKNEKTTSTQCCRNMRTISFQSGISPSKVSISPAKTIPQRVCGRVHSSTV